MKYQPHIDGLRALAVLPVLMFHAAVPGFSGGFVGVDVFFVISGYLITGILAEEIQNKRFSILRFYERRARRILPALMTMCAACVPFAWFLMTPAEYVGFSRALAAVPLFVSNVFFWRETDYFAPDVERNPLLHTWSLAVEEQFYLLFPLLLLILGGGRGRAARTAIIALAVASLALAVFFGRDHPSANFYLLPTRAWELGVGAVLALAPPRALPVRWAAVGGVLGLALIVGSVSAFSSSLPHPGLATLAPVLGSALIIHCVRQDDPVGRVLSWRPVVGIGLVSYSLYLWHQPALAFARLAKGAELGVVWTAAALAVAGVLAFLTWKFVETPFRRREVVSARGVAVFSVAASAAIFGIAAAGHLSQGFPSATPARAALASVDNRMQPNYGLSAECDRVPVPRGCTTTPAPEVVLWGDSVAMQLADVLLESRPGLGLAQITKSACGPILGLAPVNASHPPVWARECLAFNNAAMTWIRSQPSVKYVVLSSLFTQYTSEDWGLYTPEGNRAADSDFVRAALLSTVQQLVERGITPVIVSPPPSSGEDLGHCLVHAVRTSMAVGACDFPLSASRVERRGVLELLDAMGPAVRVVRLEDFMCADGTCRTRVDNVLLYRDRVHLTREGARWLGARAGFYEHVVGSEPGTAH